MQANTSYKSFSPVQVNVDIGLHIGLAGVNVTLRGESDGPIWNSGVAMAPGGPQLLLVQGPLVSGGSWDPAVPMLLAGSAQVLPQQDLSSSLLQETQ